MSTRLRLFVVGVIAALPGVFLFQGQASAACVNAVNASVLGNAEQNNDCPTSLGLPGAGVPSLPLP
ncbi:MAG TPA: hypothetical protein VHJ40_08155 [Actinomycetota bacterium]|nr:hypothetical protein [Actinomycetota bacterium]